MSDRRLLVLVVGSTQAVGRLLEASLPADDFRVVSVTPGDEFEWAVHTQRPDVAVLDGVHERLEQAKRELRLLKKEDATIPIIAVSQKPSLEDASLVELGVFFYLADPAEQNEVVPLVQAAAKKVARSSGKAES